MAIREKNANIIACIILGSVIFGLVYGMFLIVVDFENSVKKETEIKKQAELKPIFEDIVKLEQHKFYLKEMNTDTLIGGSFSGSFLLAGGSVYGQIGENNYINVVYFDDDSVIDNTTDVYKMTKFNMETIEIVTIPKSETPYYMYIGNTYEKCNWENTCNYKIKIGIPRLFLSEGWTILPNN